MESVEQVLNGVPQDYLADPEFQYQDGPIDRLDSILELDDLGSRQQSKPNASFITYVNIMPLQFRYAFMLNK